MGIWAFGMFLFFLFVGKKRTGEAVAQAQPAKPRSLFFSSVVSTENRLFSNDASASVRAGAQNFFDLPCLILKS
ncbi:hypothetical protein ACFL27_21970 [candidate division CSSED10-310 bacterium]|uniref:Secreted protein n=1 Tax=candidate division CSSED10-310 bacterium TaxID=2855610 RepID=A0ABV6Z359_UNCC1